MMKFHFQWKVMFSIPEYMKRVIGIRLVIKEVFTACVIE